MRRLRSVVSLVLSLLFTFLVVFAQSSARSVLTGDITDPSAAVVNGAEVTLTDLSTNVGQTTTTSQAGHYVFPAVQPGQYKLTVKKAGFRQTVTNVTVNVGQNVAQNLRLELGGVSETVEVRATGAELQTVDASVGNVMSQRTLQSLPSLSRDATALLQLQPMASPSYNTAPGTGEGNTTSGSVAGALNDQNTFSLDGGDATSNTEGDANYVSGQGSPRAVIPTPVESIEEFRVTTNNSNTFARSSGAQVQMTTRHGSNDWHGAAYEYNQNTLYNANRWELNHVGKDRPRWHDNRYGGRIGGPLIRDQAFFFLMYEGRNFSKGVPFTRLVPSELMKQGILQFHDATGAINQFNFATGAPTAMCASGPCDPRSLGMSPLISQIWNTFEPVGNDPTKGDGLNTIGFVSSVPLITKEYDGIARFDYNLSQNWTANAVTRYAVTDSNGSAQVDIGGLTGGTKGVPKSTDNEPLQPRYYVFGLTGRIGSKVTSDTHFDFLRHYWQWARKPPFPQVSGLGAAVQIYAESNINGLVPMNIDTQNARSRVWDGKDYNLNEEMSWLRGAHLLQFGGAFRHQHFYHVRDDKVVGGLAEPIYFAEWTSSNMDISGFRPSSLATKADRTNWDKLYAAMMGMIDHSAQLLVRKTDLSPATPGTPNTQNTLVNDYDLHIVDTWRMTPSFTLAYGLDWGLQTPPYETSGLQTVMVDTSKGNTILPYDTWANNMVSAALAGQAYSPVLGFLPIRQSGRKYPYDMDWHNFAPRLSIAWNPRGGSGLLNSLFGDGKSVIRAGYGRYFDRINGVGVVMTPALGVGFGNGVTCAGPTIGGQCGTGKVKPDTGFRIGVDGGTVPIPPLQSITAPVVPSPQDASANYLLPGGNTPKQTYDFRIDPHRKTGVEDAWTLSIQRQLSNSMIMEVGYVGRHAIHLYSGNDVNQIPYMFTAGGQTFASAYDNIQRALIAGTPVPAQPFLQAVFPDGTAAYVSDKNIGSYLANGDATDAFDALGLVTLPIDGQFSFGSDITTSKGMSNYNAGYISLRKQMTQGLMFQANYTLSHSMDDSGLAQEYVFFNPTDGFNMKRDYTNSYFDRRHVFTGFFVYDLPFGKGHQFGSTGFLSKLLGGWEISSAITASSGLPQKVYNNNSCTELGDGYLSQCASWIPTGSAAHTSFSRHTMPDGSINVYGSNWQAVEAAFRMPLFSDSRMGGTPIVGFPRWNVDAALNKTFKVTERVGVGLSLQAVNVFNHMEFTDPSQVDISNTTTFGETSTQYNSPRFLNIGIRIDF